MPGIYTDHALLLPTLFALVMLILLCAAGLFSSAFKDNWLQHIGLFGFIIGAITKAIQLIEGNTATLETAILMFSALVFGLGTAYKVWWHSRYKRPYTINKKLNG